MPNHGCRGYLLIMHSWGILVQGFGDTHPHNPKVVADMTSLHHIHEASILYNLRERAKVDNQRPYTFMVRVLFDSFTYRVTGWDEGCQL